MSSLVVKVTSIDELKSHPNADRLDLAVVGGWQCVVAKGQYAVGEKIVYFPPDTTLPQEWTDLFGVTQYAQLLKDTDPPRFRIRCAKLRGEPSFGLVIKASEYIADAQVEDDASVHFQAEKYVPPVKAMAGDAEADDPRFPKYTDIENLRNFPDVLRSGELVYVTEKLHGTSCRVGLIAENGGSTTTWMAGSKALRRKNPGEDSWGRNMYWLPLTLEPVRALLQSLIAGHEQVVLFGEVFGKGVQAFDYGLKRPEFRAFDLMVDGKYLDAGDFVSVTDSHGVERVPWLGSGPYSPEWVADLSKGKAFSGTHIREGVVVKPLLERQDPKVGRVILKYVSDAYLLGQTEDFTDQ